MKIGLFVGTHQTFMTDGGIGRYSRSLDKYMAGKPEKEVYVKRLEAPPSKYEIPSTLVWSMFLKSNEYDIVHVVGPLPFFPLLFKKHRNTIITTAHDFMPTTLIAANIHNLKDKVISKFMADMRISLNSDYLIAISTQTRDEAVQLGFERNKIKVINYGIDESFFAPIKKRKKNKEFVVGYIGTFPFRKNVRMAIDAFMRIKDRNIRFDLHARKDMEYENLVRQAKGDKRIKFFGPMEENEIPATYDTFDVSVFPSIHEGFGLPIIEAQTRGLPVVVYKHSNVPKEVRKMCFEVDDEAHMADIIKGLKDNGFNERRRKATIKYARSFTWEKNIRQTIEFYKEVS